MDWKLEPHPSFGGVEGPVLVCVMDGVGIGRHDDSDAVWLAKTPNLDRLGEVALTTRLSAHGVAVGMPDDTDMGNSEVGHNALGAGRIFDQGAKLVAHAIESGSLFEGETWRRATARVRESGEPLHLMGLLSDGNVHSHIEHLFSLLRRCDAEAVRRVRVHILLDGRDVAATSALEYVEALEALLAAVSESPERDYRIASGGGRMRVTMDRYEADWGMVELGWKTHVRGEARHFTSAREAIETFRGEEPGLGDQHLPAFVIADESGEPLGRIRDGAAVIFFNFRGDRAIAISRAFEDEHFEPFDRGPRPDVFYAGMMQYDGDLELPRHFLVVPPAIDRTVGEYLVRNDCALLAISETQKFGHVTYFWNGNRSGYIDESRENYIEIPGDPRPFEEQPGMMASAITDRVIEELSRGSLRHVRLNYANGDMVGHTGVHAATVKAVEAVDHELGRLIPLVEKMKGAMIVTADHGNADCMFDVDSQGHKQVKTSHTLNAVPLHILAPGYDLALRTGGAVAGLGNVAPTLLQLLGYRAPEGYLPPLLA
jgi:2,3-bisphosphoglycerate-independent phosphoglycerate mutase